MTNETIELEGIVEKAELVHRQFARETTIWREYRNVYRLNVMIRSLVDGGLYSTFIEKKFDSTIRFIQGAERLFIREGNNYLDIGNYKYSHYKHNVILHLTQLCDLLTPLKMGREYDYEKDKYIPAKAKKVKVTVIKEGDEEDMPFYRVVKQYQIVDGEKEK